jgi:hypothetical protein
MGTRPLQETVNFIMEIILEQIEITVSRTRFLLKIFFKNFKKAKLC